MGVDDDLQHDLDWLMAHPKSRLRAYGHNLAFDPKLSSERLNSLKAAFATPPPADLLSNEERATGHSILGAHHLYYNRQVRRRAREPDTFMAINDPASFGPIQENTLLVRLEILNWALKETGTDFDLLLEAFTPGRARTAAQYNYIAEFLRNWNESSHLAPQFAARENELRGDLKAINWAERLRIRLGLEHFKPDAEGKPIPIALMIYRASEVRARRRGTTGISHLFVRPTALDQRPGEYFFPAPPDMIGGRCMPLLPQPVDGARLFCEILHPKFDYRVENLVDLTRISSTPPKESLKLLRNSHLACLREVGNDRSFGEMMGDDVRD